MPRAHGFTGTGVTGTGYGYGGPGSHGYFSKKPGPARLIHVPVYPCIPVARTRSSLGTDTGTDRPVQVEPPEALPNTRYIQLKTTSRIYN